MLFILTRDGDEVGFDMQDGLSGMLAATTKLVRDGYVQYTQYYEFMNDEDSEPQKRMLLVEGQVLRHGS